MAEAMREADAFEGFADAGWPLGAVHFSEAEGEFEVFLEGHAGEQVEGLKNHANGVAAVAGEGERRERGDVPAEGMDGAGCGAVEAGDEIQKRGLSRAGCAKKGEEFVGGDGERDFVDGADGGFAHGVVPGNVVKLDGGIGGGHESGVK